MTDIKIKVDDKGNLTINACDLFETLEDDSKKEIIAALAWESPMWDELKRGIKEDYARPSWNDDIWKLRLAFLQGEDIDVNVRDAIRELLSINKKLNVDMNKWRDAYYKWYHWWSNYTRYDDKARPLPSDAPGYESVTATNTELETVLKELGITQDIMANPLGEKDEVKVTG